MTQLFGVTTSETESKSKSSNIKFILIAVACAAAALFGLYYFGYQQGVKHVEQQVIELNKQHEIKIDELQNEHTKTVTSITTKYAVEVNQLNEQIATLQDDKEKYQYYIGTYVPATQHTIVPNGFIVWHDRAARGDRLDQIVLQDKLDNPSQYTYNDVMYAVGYNYSQANLCYTRLDALQSIVKDFLNQQNK